MSNNKDSQSAREAQCLESLRRSMFTKIYHDMGDMNGVCVECDGLIVDDDFRERHYFGLCSPQSFDFARGVYEGDVYVFEQLVATAVQQCQGTVFPDFISPCGGFTEHFFVTGATDNGKGAADKIDAAEVERNVQVWRKTIMERTNMTSDGDLRAYYKLFVAPLTPMSHDKFVRSFKKHWQDHIDSLDASGYGQCYPRAFMIDTQTSALNMHERLAPGMSISEPRFYCGLLNYRGPYKGVYSLVRDVELLQYLLDYKNKVDFVIFLGGRGLVEIIKIASIVHMLPLLGCNFDIGPAYGHNFYDTRMVVVPNFDVLGEN